MRKDFSIQTLQGIQILKNYMEKVTKQINNNNHNNNKTAAKPNSREGIELDLQSYNILFKIYQFSRTAQKIWDMQRNKNIWSLYRKNNQSTEDVPEEAQILGWPHKDFKSAILNAKQPKEMISLKKKRNIWGQYLTKYKISIKW